MLVMGIRVINDHIAFPNFPEAKCTSGDPDYFFPVGDKQLKERLPELQAICDQCPHKKDCADFAINNNITDGVWGGFSPHEIASMIENQGKSFERIPHRLFEILMKREMGWSDDAIAHSMGIHRDSVSRQLFRAKEKGYIS